MLQAPGLGGAAAAGSAKSATAAANVKISMIVVISFLLISLLLCLGARLGRAGDRNDVGLRAGRQDVRHVEVDSVWPAIARWTCPKPRSTNPSPIPYVA